MSFELNSVVTVTHEENTVSYFYSSKHRGTATAEISVWSVDFDTELTCFKISFQKGWHNNQNGWGFVPVGIQKLSILGHNLRNSELIIAKFVSDQDQWHGYPADIRHKPKDKPLPNILLEWLKEGFISKSTMLRIKQGQI